MSVMVILEAPVKSENVSNIKSYMAELLPESRAYDGCQGMEVYFNTEDGNRMVLVERSRVRTTRSIWAGAPRPG